MCVLGETGDIALGVCTTAWSMSSVFLAPLLIYCVLQSATWLLYMFVFLFTFGLCANIEYSD